MKILKVMDYTATICVSSVRLIMEWNWFVEYVM